jgi:hypothetical protein
VEIREDCKHATEVKAEVKQGSLRNQGMTNLMMEKL